MSGDLEAANESARWWEEISSYITMSDMHMLKVEKKEKRKMKIKSLHSQFLK